MKLILFLSLLATFLFGQNPKAYSVLGDTIFNNAGKIAKLENIIYYKPYKEKIQTYQKNILKTKAMGLRLDATNNSYTQKKYLKKLRELIVINDFFLKLIDDDFLLSIENKNNKLFSNLINKEIIDIDKHHKIIMKYYKDNMQDILIDGLLKEIVDNHKKLTLIENQKKVKQQIKRETAKEKIQRIKEKDRLEQLNMERSLENERVKTKEYLLKLKEMQENKRY